ncbi:hypothetical protein B0T14DRAFT_279575 [Immersiella caudata]|uniref:Uncharacterized protein n=1 Tax=Immersiella caudata TaxID=314043 RepID=A0AA40BTW3_9PEZI|nr:hypothetical protein B0T14DRAFT_279575 [Immersiella caudata]
MDPRLHYFPQRSNTSKRKITSIIIIAAAFMAHNINAVPLPQATEHQAVNGSQPSPVLSLAVIGLIVACSLLFIFVVLNFFLAQSRSGARQDRIEFRNIALYFKNALQVTLEQARNGTLDPNEDQPWLPYRNRRAATFLVAPRISPYLGLLSTIEERTEGSSMGSPVASPSRKGWLTVAGPSQKRASSAPVTSRRRTASPAGPLNSNPIELRELRKPSRLSGGRSPARTDKGKGKEVELPEASDRSRYEGVWSRHIPEFGEWPPAPQCQ